MQDNGYERELKHQLARLPQHKKMPEATKQRILQAIQQEENKLRNERNVRPLRSKLKWATLTLAAGLILVIGAFSLKNQVQTPNTGITQGAHENENPFDKINTGDIHGVTVTDGTNGKKTVIDDSNDSKRAQMIFITLRDAHPKQIKMGDVKGYRYRFEFNTDNGTMDVTFLGNKVEVENKYYSLAYDETSKIESFISDEKTTTDNKSTKTETPTTTNISMTKVANFKMFGNGVGWLQSDEGLAFTNNGGVNWKTVTPNIGSNSTEMAMPKLYANGKIAWFALYSGDTAFIYKTNDGGEHWTKTSFKTDQQMIAVKSIQFSDDQHGYLLFGGDEATGNEMISIYKTNDGGTSWTLTGETLPGKPSNVPYSGMKTSVVFKDDKIGWITGMDGSDIPAFYQTKDGGKTWKHQDITIPNGYTADGGSSMTYAPIFFNQNDGILPVRFGGDLHPYVFYVTHNGGGEWVPTNGSIHTAQGFVDMNDWDFVSQKVGFATTGKQLFVTNDGGNHWTTVELSRELSKIHFLTEKVGYAISESQLLKTTDGGNTWNTVTTFK